MYAVGELFNTAQRASASSDRVYEVLESQDDRKVENVKEIKVLFGDIEFSDYNFKYPSSEVINLSDINLKIKEGETLGIAGKTGSGKSTLIKQILAQYPVGEGKFTISGVPFLEVDKINLMNDIAYVSQENILFSRSIKENILFGSDEKVSDEELESIIELADLKRDINIFTNGVDTQVGERGIAVSGGQKQRIAIARAIIKNAKLLILDDSLSAVDARTESKIIRNIKKNRQNKTTIIISHRLSAISHADNIIVLDNGRIVEQGTHDELVSTDTWYLRQYNIQKLEEGEHE
jgi:ABC superfamily ATP binding cassette transporter, ABC protein